MHVAQIISGGGVDGAAQHGWQLALMLRDRGHGVSVVCRPGSWVAARSAGVPGIGRIENSFRRRPSNLRACAAELASRGVDIVHTHKSSAHAFGAILRLFWKLPCVATAHSRHLQLHWGLNDHVIAPSEHTASYLRRYNLLAASKVSTIPYPFSPPPAVTVGGAGAAAFRRQWGVPPERFLIGVVGSVIERKGLMTLARAMPLLRAAGHSVSVVAVGGQDAAYVEKITRFLRGQGLQSDLIFAGPSDDVPRLLPAFDLICLPSREEQLPLAVLEAMHAARPVVVTPVGGLKQLVRDGVDGVLAPVDQPTQWAAKIAQLIDNPQQRIRLARAAQQRVRDFCCASRVLEEIEQVYQRVLRRGSRLAVV